MIRLLAILLAVSVAGNAGMAWWGLHEYGRAERAASDARASLNAAQTAAETRARTAQKAADDAALRDAMRRASKATQAATNAALQVATSRSTADAAVRQLHEVQSHAKSTDCINRRLPDAVRRVLTGADDPQR